VCHLQAMYFHNSYQEKHWKMHLWRIVFLGFSGKKCSFLKHSSWSTIFENSRWTPILSLIIFKCLEKFLLIVKDHMYTVNFVAQVERNSFNLGCKITSWNLVGPSLVTTSIPFKSKIKWYPLTFDSTKDFFDNQNVVAISCDLCSKCGSYVNVSLTFRNSMQIVASSNPIIWFSSNRDGH
jgi:hypothetical protein